MSDLLKDIGQKAEDKIKARILALIEAGGEPGELLAKIRGAISPPKMPEGLAKDINETLQGLEATEDAIGVKLAALDTLVEGYNRKIDAWQDVANRLKAWRRSVGLGSEELDIDIESIDVSISSIDPCSDYGALRWSALNGVG